MYIEEEEEEETHRKVVSGIIFSLLLIDMLTLAFDVQVAKTEPATITVPDDYPTIQGAINAVNSGDAIFVRNGTYYENMVVNKSLTLIGENRETIIDGNGTGNVVYVTADWVNITGFTITNSGSIAGEQRAGIKLYRVQNCYIENNNVSNNKGCGIYIYAYNPGYSNNNTVSNNTINLNYRGIEMEATTDSAIMNNIIDSNSEGGIYLYGGWCHNNIIKKNTISNTLKFGIFSFGSNTGNLIFHNNFINNTLYEAYDTGTNFWDNGYPSGGNYWSDYTGVDLYSGPYQNETESEGIGDTPYVIDAGNQDNYPLMHPYGSIRNLDTNLTYLTIQSAINAPETLNGHTIQVSAGTYYEHVTVSKSLTLVGENAKTTIIECNGTGHVIYITANTVTVTGFTIQNGGSSSDGVRVWYSSNIVISNNRIFNNQNGLFAWFSSNISITNNLVANNGLASTWGSGIQLTYSSHNYIAGNKITNNSINGLVCSENSHNNLIVNNTINNTHTHHGISIWDSSCNNTVTNNIVYGSELAGLFIGKSSHNNILTDNIAYNNHFGIGIWDQNPCNNTISGNIVRNNLVGIDLYNATQNHIYHNSFIDNTQQVIIETSNCPNFWDDGYPSGGNYWSDYAGIDMHCGPDQNETGSDGIGDTPYVIDENNADRYPFMTKYWKTSFIRSDGYPIVDFAVYNGKLYAAADNALYTFNGSNWSIIDAPAFILSLEPYKNMLVVGGEGGLYLFNGTDFTLVFTVSTYIQPLGVYNNTLYAGTVLDNPPTLYYCTDSPENPDNWHLDASFSSLLNFSGPFGSIDSFAVYNNKMYVASGGTVYCYNGTNWTITKTYDDVCAYLDMEVYNGKLYLATRDQAWRKPVYQGYCGFSGRVIEFDGNNWTTVFDHDYWVYSLEVFDDKLYAGTANKICTYDGTSWSISFEALDGAYYAISLATFNNSIYAGMGNGYILEDPPTKPLNTEPATIPEYPSSLFLLIALTFTTLAIIVKKKKLPKHM